MVVFDTEALLIFYLGEEGADVVENILRKIKNKEERWYLNIINLTEFSYIVCRRDPEIADEEERKSESIWLSNYLTYG